ncbi:MAG: PP2C family protein-serine/threonine phosphatase [Longimicrobiales bacterium]
MAFRITAFGLSHQGRVRPKNEDAMAVEPSRGIVMVADGMGGAPSGEVASALAVQEVCRGLHEGQGMRDALLRANARILTLAAEQASLAGMGTTLTALRVKADTGAFEIGHVGDSRAYRLAGGQFWQITKDHTVVAEMVEAGTLSPSNARGHHLGHILSQALGTYEDPEVEVLLGQAEAGDRFLVCSDGLTRVMEDDDLEESLLRSREVDLEDVVRGVVEEANRRGAPDNVTMAILAVGDPS